MIVIKIMGGLGNQMFQYALGRRLAIENNQLLKLDIRWFDVQEKRNFELNQFNIDVEIATKRDLENFPDFSNKHSIRGIFNRILKRLPSYAELIFREKKNGIYDPNALIVNHHKYLEGYWHSEKYFKPIEQQIRKDFTLKKPLSNEDKTLAEEMRSNPNSVSVHIRRGDYVTNFTSIKTHFICTPDYYNETMRLIKKKLGDDTFFYIFSDDPDWCQSGLNYPSPFKIVSTKDRMESQELLLMSNCRNAILSNSSFSWWGAWLGDNYKNLVIYPKKWFYNRETPDLPLENWTAYQHDTINDWKYIDIPYAKSRYKAVFDQELDLEHPKTFSEKIQWIKIYDHNPLYQTLTDKFAVREFVTEKIGAQHLTNIYGIYERASQIEWQKLPNKFVLKTNHGSGWNIRCENKKTLDINETINQLDDWLAQNYYYRGREWVYKDISPKIICEEFLEGENNLGLMDYKFFCFQGAPKYVQVDVDRFNGHKRIFFDLEWKKLGFTMNHHPLPDKEIPKPTKLDQMIEISKILSNGFPFVRVDLYALVERVVFSELTFYPMAGFCTFHPPLFDSILGSDIILPCQK